MNDFIEMICVIVIATLVMALLIGGAAVGFAYGISRPSCYADWRNSGLLVRWSFWGDCQVSEDGKLWMVDDAYVTLHKRVKVAQ